MARKKLISLILAFILLLSMLPASVFGVDDTQGLSSMATVLPDGTKWAFTFDNGLEGVRNGDNASKYTWTTLSGDGVVNTNWYGTGIEKINIGSTGNNAVNAAIKASQNVKLDFIISQADYNALPDNFSLSQMVVAHAGNGWWQTVTAVNGPFDKARMEQYGVGYYKLTAEYNIAAQTGNYSGSGSFFLQPIFSNASALTGPVYIDNIILYTPIVYPTGVAVNPASLTIGVGGTAQLAPVFTPAGTTDTSVVWSSSDPDKVTVDEKGMITAIATTGPETVTITAATSKDGLTGTCEVTVVTPIKVSGVKLSQTSLNMTAGWGFTENLTATVVPAEATIKTIRWESDNINVAKVRNGNITAIGAGEAHIRAIWTEDDSVYGECVVTVSAPPQTALGDGSKRISTQGSKFVVGPLNKQIWMNGVNTPWIGWNEFAYSNVNWNAWRNEFSKLHENGVNATRIWVLCDGTAGIQINQDGYVTGVSQTFWDNMDQLFALAKENGVYIMATLASFDFWSSIRSTAPRYHAMLGDSDKIDSYVENYVIPFVNRYGSSDYLWSIDLCNEAEWIFENYKYPDKNDISEWVARSTVGIHKANPDVLVTFGLSMTKYLVEENGQYGVDPNAYKGNMVADDLLASFFDDPADKALARLDFYSSHFYSWAAPWFGNPFAFDPETYAGFGDRPAVIGETSASGSGWTAINTSGVPAPGAVKNTALDDYKAAFERGWQGAFMWSSDGVDSNGGWGVNCPTDRQVLVAQQAVNYMRDNYAKYIDPLISAETSAKDYISIKETSKGSRVWVLSFTVTETYLDGKVAVIPYDIEINANNANVKGSYDLGDYTLIYDIKESGSIIKAFNVIIN